MAELSPEDRKLQVLARSAAARLGTRQGAAVRDLDGRTYAAGPVALESLALSPLQVCLAMAVTSGAKGLEAALVMGGGETLDEPDRAVLTDFAGEDVVVIFGG